MRIYGLALTFGLTVLCSYSTTAPAPATAAAATPAQPVQVQMRNVALHVDENTVLDVARLRGALISTRTGQPPIFDDKNSFVVRIDSAEVSMTAEGLTRLMNDYAFSGGKSPLRDVQIAIDGHELKITGALHRGIKMPFAANATAAVDRGSLRLHATSVKVLGLPVKKAMSLFKVELEKLITLKQAPGVRVDGDDFLVDPSALLPPPRIEGPLQAVRLEQNRIVQIFGPGHQAPLRPPDATAPNYMYYRGGVLRFGKLTMTDADMQLIDRSPSDPFDFFQDHYSAQLVAGYSKNTPDHALKVYMPDYYRLRRE